METKNKNALYFFFGVFMGIVFAIALVCLYNIITFRFFPNDHQYLFKIEVKQETKEKKNDTKRK